MTVKPLVKINKIKKRTKRFTRFESEDYPNKLSASWRRPRGIDNRVRRQYKSNKPLVSIGYGTKREHKHVLPNGFKKLLIRNSADLEMLLMNNRVYCGEFAHNLSSQKRKVFLERAKQINVKITNAKGKLVTEDKN